MKDTSRIRAGEPKNEAQTTIWLPMVSLTKNESIEQEDFSGKLISAAKESVTHELTMSIVRKHVETTSDNTATATATTSENETNVDTLKDLKCEYCFVLKDNICNFRRECVLCKDKNDHFEYVVFMEVENCHCFQRIDYVANNLPTGHRFGIDWSCTVKD